MKDFWKDRWQSGNTPWHQAQIEQLLVRHFSKSVKRAFVPLCGKTLDMLWLLQQGVAVVGNDLSEIACRDFFAENKIECQEEIRGRYKIFKAPSIELWAGDFFEMDVQDLGAVDFIYDRASLFALPPGEIRDQYVQQIKAIPSHSRLKNFQMLVIGRKIEPPLAEGPPFSVLEEDIRAYFEDVFSTERLESVARPSRSDIPGVITETAYRLAVR
jgi:thiopurine S-methyltransferase